MTYDLVKAVEEITREEGRDGGVGWEMFSMEREKRMTRKRKGESACG